MKNTDSECVAQTVAKCVTGEPDILLAILHGSVARGRATARSDVDLAVACAGVLPADRLDDLRLRVEAATGRAADIVDLHRIRGVFLTEILTGGRVLVNRRPTLLAGLMVQMLDFQEDFLPAVRLIRRHHAEALAHGS